MARNTGPVCRQCRREQAKLFLKGEKCYTKCVLDQRPTPPGSAKPQRGKPSEYQKRLREKQKLRRMIAMTERPFRRLMERAAKSSGKTAAALMTSLETRLTPAELEVAQLLRDGKTSDEIAELLNISVPTVSSHRSSIRRKLGLVNKSVNLKSYLRSFN